LAEDLRLLECFDVQIGRVTDVSTYRSAFTGSSSPTPLLYPTDEGTRFLRNVSY